MTRRLVPRLAGGTEGRGGVGILAGWAGVDLERYGHEWGPVVQPAISTVRFFGDLAVLPYKMGIHPPNECQHPLGYHRPGSCAPWGVRPIPISGRGAVAQAAFVTGTVFALP